MPANDFRAPFFGDIEIGDEFSIFNEMGTKVATGIAEVIRYDECWDIKAVVDGSTGEFWELAPGEFIQRNHPECKNHWTKAFQVVARAS